MTTPDSAPGQPGISLRVHVPAQRLDLLRGDTVLASYPVSTSKFGLGSEPGSFRTPLGRFVVDARIGDGAPAWAVFKSRQPTGEIAHPGWEGDGILTRILWLHGLDPHNANTRDRYIYLHGTNEEHLIGTPASHGCIRLRNADIIDLFARVPAGTPVEILG